MAVDSSPSSEFDVLRTVNVDHGGGRHVDLTYDPGAWNDQQGRIAAHSHAFHWPVPGPNADASLGIGSAWRSVQRSLNSTSVLC